MNNKLSGLLEYAKNHNNYYRNAMLEYENTNAFAEGFRLTKDDVINYRMQLFSDIYSGTMYSTMQVNATSGTSGKPLKVYWSSEDLARSNLCVWRERKKYYNISPNDLYCSLHTTSYYGTRVNKIQKLIVSPKNISFCKLMIDDQSLSEYYEALRKYKPVWLMVQPGFMSLLVEYMKKKDYKPVESIKYIEFTGEMLTEVVRNNVEEYFKCKTANMYGCMEVNTIAYECPCGTMHVLTENVSVRTDEGNICVTSLHNHAFPLINYLVGDKVDLVDDYKCGCGKRGPVIKKILGRSNKQVLLPNGVELNEATISYCMDRAEAILGIGIKQYKAKYSKDVLTIIVVAENKNIKWKDIYIKTVNDMLREFGCFVTVKYEFVDHITEITNSIVNSKYTLLDV